MSLVWNAFGGLTSSAALALLRVALAALGAGALAMPGKAFSLSPSSKGSEDAASALACKALDAVCPARVERAPAARLRAGVLSISPAMCAEDECDEDLRDGARKTRVSISCSWGCTYHSKHRALSYLGSTGGVRDNKYSLYGVCPARKHGRTLSTHVLRPTHLAMPETFPRLLTQKICKSRLPLPG